MDTEAHIKLVLVWYIVKKIIIIIMYNNEVHDAWRALVFFFQVQVLVSEVPRWLRRSKSQAKEDPHIIDLVREARIFGGIMHPEILSMLNIKTVPKCWYLSRVLGEKELQIQEIFTVLFATP